MLLLKVSITAITPTKVWPKAKLQDVAIRRGEGNQRKRCRDPRCSPRGTPACRGTLGGRRKAVRARISFIFDGEIKSFTDKS